MLPTCKVPKYRLIQCKHTILQRWNLHLQYQDVTWDSPNLTLVSMQVGCRQIWRLTKFWRPSNEDLVSVCWIPILKSSLKCFCAYYFARQTPYTPIANTLISSSAIMERVFFSDALFPSSVLLFCLTVFFNLKLQVIV